MDDHEFMESYSKAFHEIIDFISDEILKIKVVNSDDVYSWMIKAYIIEFTDHLHDNIYTTAFTNAWNETFDTINDHTYPFKEAEQILDDIVYLSDTSSDWLHSFFSERDNGGIINQDEHMALESSENSGYIYVMMNPSMQGIVKIGFTRRTPEERLEELSKATGVPTPFILVYKEHFNDCIRAEKLIHSMLEERGEKVSSNREFFSTEVSKAIKVVQEVKLADEEDLNVIDDSLPLVDDKPISEEYLEQGLHYMYGVGDSLQDYGRAIEYLEKAGELGEPQAYYELGHLFIDTLKEEEITLDVKKAIKYFEKGRLLTGKYAMYCNAGLALCFANRYFSSENIRNYTMNEANALKCWTWFFDELEYNEFDLRAGNYIFDCLIHFLVTEKKLKRLLMEKKVR